MMDTLWERRRSFLILLLFFCLYGFVAFSLWDEQIAKGQENIDKADSQYVRRVRIPAVRGRILTADGVPLADNVPMYDLVFHINEMRMPGLRARTVRKVLETSALVADRIGRASNLTSEAVERHLNLTPAIPMPVMLNLTSKELASLADFPGDFRGIEVVSNPRRVYPHGAMACHIVGYIGDDDPSKAEDRKEYSYYNPDVKGRAGLELAFDEELRGTAGDQFLEVDAKGFTRKDRGSEILPENGSDIQLTIQWPAQKAAEEALDGNRGAMVAIDAATGSVLAMASYPSYDLRPLADGISTAEWKTVNNPEEKPQFNRAAFAEYMAGSIAKPLVALAALDAGIAPESTFDCVGYSTVGNARIHCWIAKYKTSHGPRTMREGIRDSCNVYFIEAGRRAGFDALRNIFDSAGIGRKTGIEIPERPGILPSKERKKRTQKTQWTEFDTCQICIGQGMLALTPLQAACIACALVNKDGQMWRPHVIDNIIEPGGERHQTQRQTMGRLETTEAHLKVVREGMWLVVNDREGSGAKAKSQLYELYGKTGTAQTGAGQQTWFMGFVQIDGRWIGLAASVEGGKSGGQTNAPIVKRFLERWIELKKSSIPY